MNPLILNVAFEKSTDQEVVSKLKKSLAYFGEDVAFHEVPPKGPQASLLLYGMTTIVCIFGGAFVKKLGDKAAEDAYPHIKNGLKELYNKYFGENPVHKFRIYSTSEKKAPDTKYSLILSLYCVGKNNEKVKFLYETNWTEVEFNKATEVYLSAITSFVNGENSDVNKLLALKTRPEPLSLIAWNHKEMALINVNVLPDPTCI